MPILQPQQLRSLARRRLAAASGHRPVLLLYTGIVIGLSILVNLLSILTQQQLANATGLAAIGTRSFLGSVINFLPLIQTVILLCLDLGFLNAALRISRKQFVSPKSLKLGFDRLWVLIRLNFAKTFVYMGFLILAVYAGAMLFFFTPLSDAATAVVMPLVEDAVLLPEGGISISEEAVLAIAPEFMKALIPMFILIFALCLLLVLPIYYRYRFCEFLLIDHPGMGAFAALQTSRQMLQGNRFRLFLVDLSLWPYYLGIAVSNIISMIPVILVFFEYPLPFGSSTAFVFLLFSLGVQFAVWYFFLFHTKITHAAAYNALQPDPPQENTAVLGNIFSM